MIKMLQKKLQCIAINIVNAKVKVEWLKLYNNNRFNKDALHFSKSTLSNFALDDSLSKCTYWTRLKQKSIEKLHNCLPSCL